MEDDNTVMIWYNEKGVLIDDVDYEMDYVIMSIFNKDRKIVELKEYTDSDLQKRIWKRWLKRQETEKRAGKWKL